MRNGTRNALCDGQTAGRETKSNSYCASRGVCLIACFTVYCFFYSRFFCWVSLLSIMTNRFAWVKYANIFVRKSAEKTLFSLPLRAITAWLQKACENSPRSQKRCRSYVRLEIRMIIWAMALNYRSFPLVSLIPDPHLESVPPWFLVLTENLISETYQMYATSIALLEIAQKYSYWWRNVCRQRIDSRLRKNDGRD